MFKSPKLGAKSRPWASFLYEDSAQGHDLALSFLRFERKTFFDEASFRLKREYIQKLEKVHINVTPFTYLGATTKVPIPMDSITPGYDNLVIARTGYLFFVL